MAPPSSFGFGTGDSVDGRLSSALGGLGGRRIGGGASVGSASSTFGSSMAGGIGLVMVVVVLGCVDRLVGLAVILGIGDGLTFGGLGEKLGVDIGPTMTFGGAVFGTGAGM
jgi:hypothetical protein